jgi:hypothetical protein
MKTTEPSSREHAAWRRQVIEQCLAVIGQTWAAEYVHHMATASRRVEGGWPGRLAEARTLAHRGLTQQLAEGGLGPPSADEMNRAASTVNEHARQRWECACKAERLSAKETPTNAK